MRLTPLVPLTAALLSLLLARPAQASPAQKDDWKIARELFDTRDFEESLVSIEKILARHPNDPEALRMKARIEILGGTRMERWIALHDAEKRSNSSDLPAQKKAEALVTMARLRLLIGDTAGAEKDSRKALSLSPGYGAASLSLAQALRDRPEEALPFAQSAARSGKTPRGRVRALRLAAEILLDLGEPKKAEVRLSRALKIIGDDLDTLWDMTRLTKTRPRKARGYAQRAARSAQAAPPWLSGSAHRLCARIWLEIGMMGRAEAHTRQALTRSPDDRDALELLGRIKRERDAAGPVGDTSVGEESPPSAWGDSDGLESLRVQIESNIGHGLSDRVSKDLRGFETAIQEAPLWMRLDAYRLIAEIWFKIGDSTKALRLVRRAEELGPGSLETAMLLTKIEPHGEDSLNDRLEALSAVAKAQADLGDFEKAQEVLQRALELSPDHLPSLSLMSSLRLRAGVEKSRPSSHD